MAKAKKAKPAKRAATARGIVQPPVRPDPRLKKIYVYSEGTFVLPNAATIKKLTVQTKAFDVAGWIDLSRMAPGGDTLFIEVRVS
jgi:hypothetical protein